MRNMRKNDGYDKNFNAYNSFQITGNKTSVMCDEISTLKILMPATM